MIKSNQNSSDSITSENRSKNKKFDSRTWWRCPAWDSIPHYRGPGLAAHKLRKCFNITLLVIFAITWLFSTELLLSLCHLNHRVFQKSGFLPERSKQNVTQDVTFWLQLLGIYFFGQKNTCLEVKTHNVSWIVVSKEENIFSDSL